MIKEFVKKHKFIFYLLLIAAVYLLLLGIVGISKSSKAAAKTAHHTNGVLNAYSAGTVIEISIENPTATEGERINVGFLENGSPVSMDGTLFLEDNTCDAVVEGSSIVGGKEGTVTVGFKYSTTEHHSASDKYDSSYDYEVSHTSNTILVTIKNLEISTVEEFLTLQPRKSYNLLADLDFSGIEYRPIEIFEATINGNGHVFRNLYFDVRQGDRYVGLFANLQGKIKDLIIEEALLITEKSVYGCGIIAGYMGYSASIERCEVSGWVYALRAENANGLVGVNEGYSGNIKNTVNNVSVQGKYETVINSV